MANRIFDKKNVILLKVNEDDLNTFLVDMDIDDEGNPKYCLDDFTKAICNTIPEYVFAQYEDPNIHQNDIAFFSNLYYNWLCKRIYPSKIFLHNPLFNYLYSPRNTR